MLMSQCLSVSESIGEVMLGVVTNVAYFHLPPNDCLRSCRMQLNTAWRAGIIAASQGEGPLVDLTKDQAHESSGWHQEAPNAVEDKTELQQNHAGGTEKSPVNHASTPSRRDSTSSAALSPSSSAKKHKQVDIRQFVRSP